LTTLQFRSPLRKMINHYMSQLQRLAAEDKVWNFWESAMLALC
jgi:hypothetical protein